MRPEIEEIFLQVKKHIDDDLGGKGDYESVLVLYELANTAAKKEKDKEGGKEVARYARQVIEEVIAPGCATETERVREAWRIVDRVRDADMIVPETELYKNILLFLAQNKDFDSYLLYLEYKRQEKDRFYLPKRRHLIKHGIIGGYQDLIDDKLDILCISMPPGTGKGELASEHVLTPDGFKRFGDLVVGDTVISGTGKLSTVLGVFPKPKMAVYELTFDDGSKIRCSKDHIWHVQTRDDRRRYGDKKYRNIELTEMLNNFRVENGKRANYSIDYVPKIDCFRKKDLKIDPYVLGVLLGDGCITGKCFTITTPDGYVINEVNKRLPDGYCLKHKERYDYRIAGGINNREGKKGVLRKWLEEYGLYGCHSYDKFIPHDYLYASYEERLDLLRGLLDSDGHAYESGIEYCTTSKVLADNVRELVHSLGGYCSISLYTNCGYKDADGDFIKCRDAYSLCIQFSANHPKPFIEKRKGDKYNPKRTIWKRYIENIEYVGEEETICIYIDDPSHLYITDDYIITHNTTCEKFFNSAVIGWDHRKFNLFFSHSSDITRMYYDGVLDICMNNDEYSWQEIFATLVVNRTNAKMGQFNVGAYKPFPSLQTTSKGAENAGKVRCNGYLLLDDLIGSQQEALNIKLLDKLWTETYSVDAKQRMLDGCKQTIQMTRWSVHDIIGRLQRIYEDSDRVRFIAIPDIDEKTGESNFDYEYMGFTVDFFNDIALTMDDLSYRALYKSQPIEREGLLYHEEDLRRFLSLPEKDPDAILAVCDVKGKGTDYMFLPVMYQYGEDFYLADCVCDDNSDYEIQYTKLTDILFNYKVQSCEFESNAGGDRVALEVQKRITDKKGMCSITTHPTETNKETRIIVNAEWVKKHVVFRDKSLYSPKSDYGVMMNWLFCYSTVGKNVHDDVPDGLANFRLYVSGMQPQLAKVEAAFNPFRTRGYM